MASLYFKDFWNKLDVGAIVVFLGAELQAAVGSVLLPQLYTFFNSNFCFKRLKIVTAT